nr:basic 7S globulin 2-like [Tanacetum cinerariifolium]
KEADNDHPLKSIMADITTMIEQKCVMLHTRRDGNQCPDHMARLGGTRSKEYIIFEEPPMSLKPYLLRDIEAAYKFEKNNHQYKQNKKVRTYVYQRRELRALDIQQAYTVRPFQYNSRLPPSQDLKSIQRQEPSTLHYYGAPRSPHKTRTYNMYNQTTQVLEETLFLIFILPLAGSFNPSTAFQSYPKDVTGVMALSTSPYALPAYFNQQPLNRTFSLCIPSASAAPGMLFYGNGPYYFLPHSDVDRSVDLPGNTTAMLSTTEPYTTLRTDIYNPVVRRYFMVTKRILKANPIAQFSLCYNTSSNGTQANIDFNLQGGKKQVLEETLFLIFILPLAGSFNPSTAFQSYPKDVTGVMALSTSPYALPAYFNQQPLNRTFSLCIPSASAAPGMLFYGNGPYYFLPHSDVDRSVDLPGNTTAMLSTTEPYTTLRTDIYNPVVRRYFMVTKRILKANPIAQFSLCYNTSSNGTQANIDFNLQGGKKCTIGSNPIRDYKLRSNNWHQSKV